MKTITEMVVDLTQKLRYDPSKDTLEELIKAAQVTTDKYEPVDEAEMKAVELRSLGFKDVADKLESKLAKRKKLNKITELKYTAITREDIVDFLQRRVKRYNESFMKSSDGDDAFLSSIWTGQSLTQHAPRRFNPNTYTPYIPNELQWQDASSAIVYPATFTTNEAGIDELTALARIHHQPIGRQHGVERITAETKDAFKTNGIGKFVYEEIPIDIYAGVPPQDVLESLKEHQANKCFDYFTIGLVKQIKDPILWGRINDDERRWFIRQWGKDISLDDLLK